MLEPTGIENRQQDGPKKTLPQSEQGDIATPHQNELRVVSSDLELGTQERSGRSNN